MVKRSIVMGLAAVVILTGGMAQAQIGQVQVTGTTATQAVLSYLAPDDEPCRLKVSESASLEPLVHDVNAQLFPATDYDTRPGSIRYEKSRLVVIGKRAAEKAVDGKRYSRALQAGTTHYYSVECGGEAVTGTFTTKNIPNGLTWGDPLPAAEDKPGEYGYPAIPWTDRSLNKAIDPLTGLQLYRISAPGDRTENTYGTFKDARTADDSWVNPAAALSSNDGGAYASPKDNSRGFLFLDTKFRFYRGGTYSSDGQSLSTFRATLHAWCPGVTCEHAPEEDRTLEFCLSVNGISCSSEMRSAAVKPCSANCTQDYRLEIGDGQPLMSYWGSEPEFDITHAHARSGVVNREGNTVRWMGGDKFSLRWSEGSQFVVGGRVLRVAKVDHEERLTLAGDMAGVEKEVRYEATNFGLLVRRKTVSGVQFAIGSGSFEVGVGDGAQWDPSGDAENLVSCAEKTVAGPGGEQGYHCSISYSLYWIGQSTGTVSRLGTAILPERTSDGVDGWKRGYCSGVYWDPADADVFFCKGIDNAPVPNEIIVKGRYTGDNRDAGDLSLYAPLTDCKTSASPCFEFTNLTPGSRGRGLLTQLRNFSPDAANFKTRGFELAGRQGKYLFLVARRDWGNDRSGFMTALDLSTGTMVAAAPSWKNWPMRWGGLHGPSSIGDPQWALVPVSEFRGPTSGADWAAGNGPYRSQIVSGAIGTGGEPCPARPADSRISAADWPAGDDCLQVTVDGEPCDPSPATYSEGSIRVEAGNGIIRGTGTNWAAFHDGSQILINGRLYQFAFLTSTTGRLSPAPPENFEGRYSLVLESVGNSKCGSRLHVYLQDAEPGDLFCIQPDSNTAHCGVYSQVEWVRLLRREGNTWILQRKMGQRGRAMTAPAGSHLVAYPSTCPLTKEYPCALTIAYWNFVQDPLAKNLNGSTVRPVMVETPSGHGSMKPGLEVFSVATENCPAIDGQGYTCYGYRRGSLPAILTEPFRVVSNNPAFAGRNGLGTPNSVDSHPTVPVLSGVSASDKDWFLDARPMLGDSDFSGSAARPATRIEGDLYRFQPDQLSRLRRKVLPTLASCGSHVLRDISGPGSMINGSADAAYTYCVAEKNGECTSNSTRGDVYVNCPQVSRAYCQYSGVGETKSDMRDICIGDNGAYTQAIVQVGVSRSGTSGANARVLTNGFSRYRLYDPFWNVKTTPDGQWMFLRSKWFQGQRTEVLAAKLPPFPAPPDAGGDEPRNDFRSIPVLISPPPEWKVHGAAVEFGYTPEFYCTSRKEACVKATEAGSDYTFASFRITPIACQSTCSVSIPVIPNRVVYWRAQYFDADGVVIGVSAATAAAVP